MNYVIFNGELVERSLAKVDIEDRGFQFGDGIYEVIRVYNGSMFAQQAHLRRLVESAEKIKLKIPFPITEIEKQLTALIEKNNLFSGIVYFQFTRGAAPRNHAFPDQNISATFVAYTKEKDRPIESIKFGVKAALIEDIRWLHCDIKSLNLLGNILAKQKAVEAGCYEAILHRENIVTEGSSSNTFMVKNGVLITHPADKYILNGISRRVILNICRENNLPYEEKAFTVEELLTADEVFISSTTSEITPVIELSSGKFASGEPGEITVQLQHLFEAEIFRQCGSLQSFAK